MKSGKVTLVALAALATMDGRASEGVALTVVDRQVLPGKHAQSGGGVRNRSQAAVQLAPDYKDINSLADFRAKLISEGWMPVPNPDCHEAVVGDYHEAYCRASPESEGCRACKLLPEIIKSTSDGYTLTRYAKEGVLLNVTSYGDISDIEVSGASGLSIVGWNFGDSLNAILIGEE